MKTLRTGATALVLAGALAMPAFAHDVDCPEREGARYHRGSSDVRAAQEKLRDMGYEVGTPDGVVGARTREAIMKFQSDKGLERTGRLDDHTTAALYPERGSSTSGTR
jgi:peptidoglycan hydrolase-like protein with peptidoglycan-binding domain